MLVVATQTHSPSYYIGQLCQTVGGCVQSFDAKYLQVLMLADVVVLPSLADVNVSYITIVSGAVRFSDLNYYQ